ncbi:helix-turn-helix domain-containing protein [Actinomadura sp. LD22]|uniref:Helix-turn-helix domain-containing protein n=1 Tax=Actinomadura physcomitrii TaxID=2650748 RepID=A0A6I4MFD2_9ACTN|nr:IclR family transcriptional regulator [Actinomadura physcomitrii]MWA03275.1 helix-turn-helix domain-containing protein [Actinomadura physcomitrii]
MQALERILAILESTARTASAASPTKVAEETGLSLSTVVRLMQSLTDAHVLVRSADTGQYRIGPRLVGIVARATQSFDYRIAAQPLLDNLRDITQETASLHMLQGNDRMCVAAAYTTQPFGRIVPIGLPFPVAGSAAGHALLSQLDDGDLERVLNEVCEGSQVEIVRAAVQEVREQGFTVAVNQAVAGIRGIAMPVGKDPGLGCLSVSGPASRFDDAAAAKALPPLQETAEALVSMRALEPPAERPGRA